MRKTPRHSDLDSSFVTEHCSQFGSHMSELVYLVSQICIGYAEKTEPSPMWNVILSLLYLFTSSTQFGVIFLDYIRQHLTQQTVMAEISLDRCIHGSSRTTKNYQHWTIFHLESYQSISTQIFHNISKQ